MSDIKPIETRYKGYRFRSRLEARWAVFFDALDIKWEYEPQGYRLPSGEMYLPDFWLPCDGDGMYVEVKPEGYRVSPEEKVCLFAWHVGKRVLVVDGMPTLYRHYADLSDSFSLGDEWYPDTACFSSGDGCGSLGKGAKARLFIAAGEHVGFEYPHQKLERADIAARSARFEHGETP